MTRQDLAHLSREALEDAVLGLLNERRTHYTVRSWRDVALNGYAIAYNYARNRVRVVLGFPAQSLEEAFGPPRVLWNPCPEAQDQISATK